MNRIIVKCELSKVMPNVLEVNLFPINLNLTVGRCVGGGGCQFSLLTLMAEAQKAKARMDQTCLLQPEPGPGQGRAMLGIYKGCSLRNGQSVTEPLSHQVSYCQAME